MVKAGRRRNKDRGEKIVPIRMRIFGWLIAIAVLTGAFLTAGVFVIYATQEKNRFNEQTGQALELLSDSMMRNEMELEQSIVYKIRASRPLEAGSDSYDYEKNVKKFANLLQMSKLPLYGIYAVRADNATVLYRTGYSCFASYDAFLESKAGAFVEYNESELRGHLGGTWFRSFEDCSGRVFMIKNVIDSVTAEYLGLLVLELDESYLQNQYQQMETSYRCSIAVYTTDGALLSCDEDTQPLALACDLAKSEGEGSDHEYLVTSRKGDDSDWVIAAFMQKSEIIKDIAAVFPPFLVLLIMIIVLCAFISRNVSESVTKSIGAVTVQVQKILDGRMDSLTRIHVVSNDETRTLVQAFNRLIDQLNISVQRIASAEIEKERAEYHALENQMDPHFLYNTLEGINSLARLHGDRDIVECVNRLSLLYRTAVHGTKNEIPLSEEISYVENYFELEKMIIGDRIETVIDVEEDTRELLVPKLVIQPIVENSVRHGVADMKEGGMVIVTAMLREGRLCIDVADNGKGMDRAQIEEVLSAPEESRTHVGIKAVQRRIQILYGKEYGLRIRSGEEGTTVTMELPVIRTHTRFDVSQKEEEEGTCTQSI